MKLYKGTVILFILYICREKLSILCIFRSSEFGTYYVISDKKIFPFKFAFVTRYPTTFK